MQVPCIVMVEEVNNQNLYIAVSSPDLNFNITRELEIGSQVNYHERFYSLSMPVEVQVMLISLPCNTKYFLFQKIIYFSKHVIHLSVHFMTYGSVYNNILSMIRLIPLLVLKETTTTKSKTKQNKQQSAKPFI